ncbi:hypothetical protein L208DRAFT_1261840 [Tricholoma matsutake]|nr:hypothetical protein L208DRAFT_1261840 [Tricholoma matsutake 945]
MPHSTPLTMHAPQKTGGGKCSNPIYLFYNVVPQNASGQMGDHGDKHYHCCHGKQKILMVTKLMKSNLNSFHLKHFPTMYQLYCELKDQTEPPTDEEIVFASGKKVLDPKSDVEYLQKLEVATENIQKAFAMQEANAAGPWDQAKFKCLLTEWIVACDQPFDEVEKEEFVKLMTYACHPASFNLEGKIALSLDAWTLSNQYAFMAIVAHYVTNEGQLGMLTIRGLHYLVIFVQ